MITEYQKKEVIIQKHEAEKKINAIIVDLIKETGLKFDNIENVGGRLDPFRGVNIILKL